MSQLFLSGGQSTGVSASALVLPVTIQGWFPLRLTLDLLADQGNESHIALPWEAHFPPASIFKLIMYN